MDHTATNPEYRVVGELKTPADVTVGGYLELNHGAFYTDSLSITLVSDGSSFLDFEPKGVDAKAVMASGRSASRRLYFPNGLPEDVSITYQRVYKEDEEDRKELADVLADLGQPITDIPFNDLRNKFHAYPNPADHQHSGESLVGFDTLIGACIAMSRRDGLQPEDIMDQALEDLQRLKENELLTANQYIVGAVNEVFVKYSRIDMNLYQEMVDEALGTDAVTIVGGINEVKGRVDGIVDVTEYLDNYQFLESSLGQDINMASEQSGTSKAYICKGSFRVLGDFLGGVTQYDVNTGDLIYYDADTDLLFMVPVGTLTRTKQAPTAAGLVTGNPSLVGSLNMLYILVSLITGQNRTNPFVGLLNRDTDLSAANHNTDCFYVVSRDNVTIVAPWGGNSNPTTVNAGKIIHFIKAENRYEIIDGNIPVVETVSPELDVYDSDLATKVFSLVGAINAIFAKTINWQTAAANGVSFEGYITTDVNLASESGDKIWLVTKASGTAKVTGSFVGGESSRNLSYGDVVLRRNTNGKLYVNLLGTAVADKQDPSGPLGNIVTTINEMYAKAMKAWGKYPDFEYRGRISGNVTLTTDSVSHAFYKLVTVNGVTVTAPWDDGASSKTLGVGSVVIYDPQTDTYLTANARAEDILRQAVVDADITHDIKHIPTLLNNIHNTFATLSLASYQLAEDPSLTTENKLVVNAINELLEDVVYEEDRDVKWLEFEGYLSGNVNLNSFRGDKSRLWMMTGNGAVTAAWVDGSSFFNLSPGDVIYYDPEFDRFFKDHYGSRLTDYLEPVPGGLDTPSVNVVHAINDVFSSISAIGGQVWNRRHIGVLSGSADLGSYNYDFPAYFSIGRDGTSVYGSFTSGGSPQTLNIGQVVELNPATGKWTVKNESAPGQKEVDGELLTQFADVRVSEAIKTLKSLFDGSTGASANWSQFEGYISSTFSTDAPGRSVMRIVSGSRSVNLPWQSGAGTKTLRDGDIPVRRNSNGKWYNANAGSVAYSKLSPQPGGLNTNASGVVDAINEVRGLKNSKISERNNYLLETPGGLSTAAVDVDDAISEIHDMATVKENWLQHKPGHVFGSFRSVPTSEAIPLGSGPVSRSTYANLFAAIGVKYGSGDGSTTFGIPEKNFGSSSGLELVGYHGEQTRMVGDSFGDSIQHPTKNRLYYTTYINGTLWLRYTDGPDDYGVVNSGGWSNKPDPTKPALLAMSEDGADIYIIFAFNSSYTGSLSFGIRKYSTVTGNLTANTGIAIDELGETNWWPNSTAKWVKSDKTMFMLLTTYKYGIYQHQGFWIDMTGAGGMPAVRVTNKWNYLSSSVDMTSSLFLGQDAIYFRVRDNDDDMRVPALEYLNPDGWRTHDFLNSGGTGPDGRFEWPVSMVDMGEGMLGMIFYDPGYGDNTHIYLIQIDMRKLEVVGEYELPMPKPFADVSITATTVLNGGVDRFNGGFWLNLMYDNEPWLCHYNFGGASASFPEYIKT